MSTKIIDGTGAVLGRLASFAAKEVLRGEDIIVLNSEKIIITGNKKDIKETYKRKRGKVGTIQVGPKVSRRADLLIKRTIRGMLPGHKKGRGREAYKKIRCYVGVPKEFEGKESINMSKERTKKFVTIKYVTQ
ncbi:MAG: 50S ribosomal protein L13 [Nanoarchaeota archaeon]